MIKDCKNKKKKYRSKNLKKSCRKKKNFKKN